MKSKIELRNRRKRKIRKSISGTADRPRLTVYRSNNHIYAQLIDDVAHVVIASASDIAEKKGTNTEKAEKVGETIAKEAKKKKVSTVIFDRNGYKYHGRIKALAEAARKAGLEF